MRTSTLFLNTREIDAAAAARALSDTMSIDDIRSVLSAAAGRWPEDGRTRIEAIRSSLDGLKRVPGTRGMLRRWKNLPGRTEGGRKRRHRSADAGA